MCGVERDAMPLGRTSRGWTDPLSEVDTRSPAEAARILFEAAEANFDSPYRQGSIDVAPAEGILLATGDLHDNPVHFAKVVQLAKLPGTDEHDPHHLTLQEVIHSDRLMGGVDLSHRALLRVAALKRKDPEEVHTLLANHELSQIVGAGIVKDGVKVVDAFNAGVEYVYGEASDEVLKAIGAFIRSMPLALKTEASNGHRGILCAHSLPGPDLIDRFDPAILERDLVEEDYTPRKGSAHIMVWGRRYTPEILQTLAERWDVELFILGHEHTEAGYEIVEPNAVILNSDHEQGAVLPLDLSAPPRIHEVGGLVRWLAAEETASGAGA